MVDVYFRIYHWGKDWQNGYRTKAQLDSMSSNYRR